MKKSILTVFGLLLLFNSFGVEQKANLMTFGGISLYGICGRQSVSGSGYMGLTYTNFYASTEYYGYDQGLSFSGLGANVIYTSQMSPMNYGGTYVQCRHYGTISRNAVLYVGGALGFQSTSSWAQNAAYWFY